MEAVRFGDRWIGNDHPCFVIAEAGVNHNGQIDLARRLIDVAAEAHVDAVKFQAFRTDQLSTERSTRDTLRKLELPGEAFAELQSHCRARGVLFLSTPFDEESADLLHHLCVPGFKVGSGDLTHHPLLAHIARYGKPLLLSTGMSFLEEVEEAVSVIRKAGNDQIVLLHCISRYPADPEEANLRALKTLKNRFDVPVGFSDHTLGTQVAVAAVALGASVLEKHITLDRSLPGPDHAASLEPPELQQLVRSIRTVQSALGDGEKKPMVGEEETRKTARRSVVAKVDISAGAHLETSMIAFKRPGIGIPPKELRNLLGRRARIRIPKDTQITWDMVE